MTLFDKRLNSDGGTTSVSSVIDHSRGAASNTHDPEVVPPNVRGHTPKPHTSRPSTLSSQPSTPFRPTLSPKLSALSSKLSAPLLLLTLTVILTAATVSAQPPFPRFRGRGPALYDRGEVPEWPVDPGFKQDVFSFARLRYSSYGGGFWGGGRRWSTDAPEADLNLLFRLQQMTSLKVNPNVTYIDITPENLANYPFVYIVEPGALQFSDAEVTALRAYLLNGGFLMVDDFWGDDEWENFYQQIKRVFPDREYTELPIEHPIFHSVFDLKEKPQMPSIHVFLATGLTYEAEGRTGAEQVHYRGFFDDKGRLAVIICHNTDLGDGWEREGEDPTYFQRFSEKMAYPMMINILFYAMTH